MTTAFRRRLLASTLFIGISSFAAPALAQTTATTPPPETNDADICKVNPTAANCDSSGDVVVTGSRIASPTLTSPSPLQVIDARDIQDKGALNVQAVLQENPAVSAAPTFSRTNSNFLTSSGGVASIDLRNLGTSRTLVLINGHRTVAGVPGTNIVDLNTIPSEFVERIEVLTGGASSVYGSDAIAGVVNFIYKKNFSGLQLTSQSGITQEGDGANYQVGAMMGANFDDNRGNVMIYAGATREKGVYSAGRDRTAVDQNACYQIADASGGCGNSIGTNGDYSRLFQAYRPFLSSFVPGGTITFGSLSRIVGPNGTLIVPNTNGLVHNSDGVPSTVRACTTTDPCHPSLGAATGFNRSAFRTIAVPVERYLLALRGNYAVSDNINATIEGNFARTQVTTLIEPFPFQTSGVNGIAPNACISGVAAKTCSGFIPIETRLADGTIVRNPYVPDFIYNNATDRTGDGLKDISFTRRLADFGPRTYTARRQTFRALAGLDGKVFGNFKWDAYYTYGQTTESQVGSGQVNLPSFLNALEVIPSGNGPICASATARAQGCAPANIFGGPGSISAAAVNYIQAGQTRNTNIEQIDTGANLSGDLFHLPAGPVGVALGVEYRKETSSAVNDALTVAGLNGGNAIANTFGTFNVKEAYGEIRVPLISDKPFFHALEVSAAGRVSDYSLSAVGTVYSWNAGVVFAPVKDIRFRAVLAHATRAPNIGELFAGRSQTFPTGLSDPCNGVTATSTTATSARCRQDAGVLANIAANGGTFTLNQSDIQGISGFNSGNPNLEAETGRTFTVGTVINPTSIHALRNFVLTVDYFNIRISHLISSYDRQGILNSCYGAAGSTQDESFCALVVRRAGQEGPNSPGSLQFINTINGNFGDYQTKGIDATLSYRTAVLGGTASGKIAYTHVFSLKDPSTPGATDSAGDEGAPRDRASGTISFSTRDFTITGRGNYIGRSNLPASFTTGVFGEDHGAAAFKIPAYFTADLQVRFTPSDHYEMFVGVNNLTNAATPLLISGIPGDSTGTETDAGTYDPIGRRFYAGVKLKF
ncbi:MAG: TonB-dependent receptor [Sphingomonas sp.]|uniref:TonB-dependent receptor domain-containing protein n=1 Tax=Sphingomonas sp. TaxID=28214 RepID=UPI001AC1053D|nr:TonB-dependent receptor [Sphingomonas sp.]MBN8808686.1 TonB-dependent receptor [Sphingomonas sp.]